MDHNQRSHADACQNGGLAQVNDQIARPVVVSFLCGCLQFGEVPQIDTVLKLENCHRYASLYMSDLYESHVQPPSMKRIMLQTIFAECPSLRLSLQIRSPLRSLSVPYEARKM